MWIKRPKLTPFGSFSVLFLVLLSFLFASVLVCSSQHACLTHFIPEFDRNLRVFPQFTLIRIPFSPITSVLWLSLPWLFVLLLKFSITSAWVSSLAAWISLLLTQHPAVLLVETHVLKSVPLGVLGPGLPAHFPPVTPETSMSSTQLDLPRSSVMSSGCSSPVPLQNHYLWLHYRIEIILDNSRLNCKHLEYTLQILFCLWIPHCSVPTSPGKATS